MEAVPNRQVKVDNWGIFFLQRLHHFFIKSKHWDLTLLFATSDKLKVHRVVLYACTDYFESLAVKHDDNGEYGDYLQLESEMDPQVVIPIIHFMYTGRLEFPTELHEKIYNTAIKLKMTILARLIDAQRFSAQSSPPAAPPASIPKNITYRQQPEPRNSDNSAGYTPAVQVTPIPHNCTMTPVLKPGEKPIVTISPVAPPMSVKPKSDIQRQSSGKQIFKSLNSSVFKQKKINRTSYNVENSVQSDPKSVLWKEIKSPASVKQKVIDPTLPPTLPGRKLPIWKRKIPLPNQIPTKLEEPLPTRFEWDEDLSDPTEMNSVEDAFKVLSHDSEISVLQPITISDDGVVYRPTKNNDRSGVPSTSAASGDLSDPFDEPPSKSARIDDITEMKEHSQQQLLRNEIIAEDDSIGADEGMDVDNDCVESNELSPPPTQSTPKPILKTISKVDMATSKRVRFSLEGKENDKETDNCENEVPKSEPEPVVNTTPLVTKQKILVPLEGGQIDSSGGSHAKIISEVLKKYPDLVRFNKNIKLKIMKKGSTGLPSTVQRAVEPDVSQSPSKVSYLYLKNNLPPPVLQEKMKVFDPENSAGPWTCPPCGTENHPLEFCSYFDYRNHLVNDHSLKIDARICQYCGHKTSKRNHLLYHMYLQHKIQPPSNVHFPKCDDCHYVALSETLLNRHRMNHEERTDLTCQVCHIVFKSMKNMQCHECTPPQGAQEMELKPNLIYRCPYCQSSFKGRDFLKEHIVSTHWSANKIGALGGQQMKSEDGEEKSVSLEASSEQESFTNVASGIATSLNLVGNEPAVVYYENQNVYIQDSQGIGGEATVSSSGGESQEYIVPGNVEEEEEGEGGVIERGEGGEMEMSNEESMSEYQEEEKNDEGGTSYSDHDYSEPNDSEGEHMPVQQIIPVHQDGQIIQQLVIPSQSNLVFQHSRLNIPQRMVLAPVLSPAGQIITHPGQNMVLQQMIPSRIILSNSNVILPHGIDPNSGIIFTNPNEVPSQNVGDNSGVIVANPMTDERIAESEKCEENMEGSREEEYVEEEEAVANEEVGHEESEGKRVVEEEPQHEDEEEEMHEESSCVESVDCVTNTVEEQSESQSVPPKDNSRKIEAMKIVDDWEDNNVEVTVESRKDGGPSRADFF